MKIVFFTFYYPPDLSAGSFRSISLVQALSKKMNSDELHIITTQPNRYESHKLKADNIEIDGKVRIYRIKVPNHKGKMFSQAISFFVYSQATYKLVKNINPDFIIGTTSRLMTGLLAGFSARKFGCNYFIDLRDIFSETISDIFSQKNRFLGLVSKKLFFNFERSLLNKACGVNVVSDGFPDYFNSNGIDTSDWSFFPNGVDEEFRGLSSMQNTSSENYKTILYAGNIGSGQGLETILPSVAEVIGNKYRFLVVGDGGSKKKLFNDIKNKGVNNIEILPPIGREGLIKYYKDADILFLHLNDIPAFKRVLPSKIFEYSSLGKPIVAGLSDHSAIFMRCNVPYSVIFKSGDVKGCVDAIQKAVNIEVMNKDIDIFVEKYSREKIMNKMAAHIFSLL